MEAVRVDGARGSRQEKKKGVDRGGSLRGKKKILNGNPGGRKWMGKKKVAEVDKDTGSVKKKGAIRGCSEHGLIPDTVLFIKSPLGGGKNLAGILCPHDIAEEMRSLWVRRSFVRTERNRVVECA